MADDLVGLGALLPLDNIEFHLVTFLQTFVPIDLDGAVMHEDVRAVVPSDEAVPFRIIEPFDFTCVLSHEPCPSLENEVDWVTAIPELR